jgi:hypothetical protein
MERPNAGLGFFLFLFYFFLPRDVEPQFQNEQTCVNIAISIIGG